MARIEIPLQELDNYKNKINNLEEIVANQDKKISSLEEENLRYKDALKYVLFEVTRAEVTLQWNKIKKAILETLPNLKKDE